MTRAPRRFATSGSCAEPRSCCVHWASSADPFPGPPTSDPLVDGLHHRAGVPPASHRPRPDPLDRALRGQLGVTGKADWVASLSKHQPSRSDDRDEERCCELQGCSASASARFRVAAFGPQRRSCSWRARADGRSHLRVRRDCCCEKNSPRRPRRDRPAGFTAVRHSSIPSRTSRARLRRGIRRRHRRGRRSGT